MRGGRVEVKIEVGMKDKRERLGQQSGMLCRKSIH